MDPLHWRAYRLSNDFINHTKASLIKMKEARNNLQKKFILKPHWRLHFSLSFYSGQLIKCVKELVQLCNCNSTVNYFITDSVKDH